MSKQQKSKFQQTFKREDAIAITKIFHPELTDEQIEKMIKVIVESPYAGDIERNERYARACMKDCFDRGEAPFASHLLYTQPGVLDDTIIEQRTLGIDAGLIWGQCADKTVLYTDLGISKGMEYGVKNAEKVRRPIEYRSLPNWI